MGLLRWLFGPSDDEIEDHVRRQSSPARQATYDAERAARRAYDEGSNKRWLEDRDKYGFNA
ncbi:hypothetical protein GCM10009557_12290 [Virgisporangium ochraceum]|uniref:Uncharacterized protein n=1 Tax=Virgisporangium ochraceum TaxID=65505 RepID=A0A8J4A7P4_9ACTN|nr:hypothetical protein Voc01_103370 [Virgisporangium ochraceum]